VSYFAPINEKDEIIMARVSLEESRSKWTRSFSIDIYRKSDGVVIISMIGLQVGRIDLSKSKIRSYSIQWKAATVKNITTKKQRNFGDIKFIDILGDRSNTKHPRLIHLVKSLHASGISIYEENFWNLEEKAIARSLQQTSIFIIPFFPKNRENLVVCLDLIIKLLQYVWKLGKSQNQKITINIITSGANGLNCVSDEFFSGSILGLIRTAQNEFSNNINLRSLDLEPNIDNTMDDNILISEILSPVGLGSEILFHHGQWSLPKLELNPQENNSNICCEYGNGVALITGGLGGLGLVSAEALVEAGLHCIVLVSRSGTIKRSNQGLEQKLESLQSIPGVQIILEKCDMSVEHQLNLY
jgi:hypothetical protein